MFTKERKEIIFLIFFIQYLLVGKHTGLKMSHKVLSLVMFAKVRK